MNRRKRKLYSEWEIQLSSNCTVTPILSLRVKAERRRERQIQEDENKKILEAS